MPFKCLWRLKFCLLAWKASTPFCYLLPLNQVQWQSKRRRNNCCDLVTGNCLVGGLHSKFLGQTERCLLYLVMNFIIIINFKLCFKISSHHQLNIKILKHSDRSKFALPQLLKLFTSHLCTFLLPTAQFQVFSFFICLSIIVFALIYSLFSLSVCKSISVPCQAFSV